MGNLFERSGAQFSPCGLYRYRLYRTWDLFLPTCLFVMLNPSKADEVDNDPTVERCERRARAWGFGTLEVVNIFALRSTDPTALYSAVDPVGPANDAAILAAAAGASRIICAWGTHGAFMGRGRKVREMLEGAGHMLYALKVNQGGDPAHPLYLPYSQEPERL
jgi:hypothetical protein